VYLPTQLERTLQLYCMVMVNVVKGGARAPSTLTSQANFTLMIECTPKSGRYHFMYSVVYPDYPQLGSSQGVTKRCRLSWLTNSALVYEPKCGGRGRVAESQPMSTAVHRSPNKLWRSNSIFTYGSRLQALPTSVN
jgi:hypothetical protein